MATIMVVDDEAQMRKLVRLMLTGNGYAVVEASTGKEALKYLEEGDVDLLITDIVMPDMDGLELIQEAKKLRPVQKVLAVSGGGQIGESLYLKLAKKFGADGVLLKPFRKEDMLEAAAALVSAA